MGVPALLAAQDPEQVVERTARAYGALQSFGADFRQVIEDPMLGALRSRGHLVQAGNDRLAMRFTDPPGEAIVMDGRYAWVYTPSTTPGQVMKIPLTDLPDYFNLGRLLQDPLQRFAAGNLREERINGRPTDVVTLTPREPDLPFTEATIWVDRADRLPRRLQFRERAGAVRTLSFDNITTNTRIAAGTFTFDVPAGVRVVNPM